jgi:hypothetical protein
MVFRIRNVIIDGAGHSNNEPDIRNVPIGAMDWFRSL